MYACVACDEIKLLVKRRERLTHGTPERVGVKFLVGVRGRGGSRGPTGSWIYGMSHLFKDEVDIYNIY